MSIASIGGREGLWIVLIAGWPRRSLADEPDIGSGSDPREALRAALAALGAVRIGDGGEQVD